MNTLFPNITPRNDEVLFIFGNGFDLSHGIESGYWHFAQWVRMQGNNRLIEMMDIFFSNKRLLWNDIETALGEYDEEAIFDYCRPDEGIDYDHAMRSMAVAEDAPDWIFQPVLDEFLSSFRDWVESIDIGCAKPNQKLLPDYQYLTFNYTETLESIYSIPKSQVVHIHGSRMLKDDYILGHNNLKDENLHDILNGELLFEQDTKNKIIHWMNGLYKDTKSIIHRNQRFFNSLGNIKQVVVRGHSLYSVDWPYFDEVANHVNKEAQWCFFYYSNEDIERIKKYISHFGISNYKLDQS